jgi:hypothetical protein
MRRHVLIFGLVGGLLIATLQYTEYRFVIIEHSVELYSALVAILFATFGIWLGLRITRSRETIRETVVVKEVFVPAEAPALQPFAPNTAHQQTLGTPDLTPPPPPRGSLPYSALSSSTKTPWSTWPTLSWSPCPSALSLLSSPLPSCAAKPLSNPPPLAQS